MAAMRKWRRNEKSHLWSGFNHESENYLYIDAEQMAMLKIVELFIQLS